MSEFFWKKFHFQMLKDQENSKKAFKKGFPLPKVKSLQKEKKEKETKYTLAFHEEGKNCREAGFCPLLGASPLLGSALLEEYSV